MYECQVRLPLPPHAWGRLVLLHAGALLLLVPLHLPVLRREEEGLLGDARPSQRHHPPHDVLLDRTLHQVICRENI